MKYILASASPRRRELFSLICPEFDVVVSDADESSVSAGSPEELCMKLAALKCRSVAAAYPDRVVIGADTIVCVDGEALGKPADRGDAVRMLEMLSGRSHHVLTGLCICVNGEPVCSDHCDTEVVFKELSASEIEDYVASGDPFDKAGSYGIQGDFGIHVKGINGDYNNVVGLPIARIYQELKGLK